MTKSTAPTITAYNQAYTVPIQMMCDYLETQINKSLTKGTAKIWHGSPVWFMDGNPVVSYSVRKNDRVSLMFFSGQSFDEDSLMNTGTFKAAEILYTDVGDIKSTHLKRWLKKAETIQWDYKNIVKRKGVLIKLEL